MWSTATSYGSLVLRHILPNFTVVDITNASLPRTLTRHHLKFPDEVAAVPDFCAFHIFPQYKTCYGIVCGHVSIEFHLPNGIFSVIIVWPRTMLNAVSNVMIAHSITVFGLILFQCVRCDALRWLRIIYNNLGVRLSLAFVFSKQLFSVAVAFTNVRVAVVLFTFITDGVLFVVILMLCCCSRCKLFFAYIMMCFERVGVVLSYSRS